MHIPHPSPRRKEILTSSPAPDTLEAKVEPEPDDYFANWEKWVYNEREPKGKGEGTERELDFCPRAELREEVEDLPLSDLSPASTLIGGHNEEILEHFLSEPSPASFANFSRGGKSGYVSETPCPVPSLTDSSGGVLLSELTTAQSTPTSFLNGRGYEESVEILKPPLLLSSASSCAPISPTATIGTSSLYHQQNIPMLGEALANPEPFRDEGVMQGVPEAAAPFDTPSHAQEDTLHIKIPELLKLFEAPKEVQDENKIRVEIPARFGPQVCERIYSGMKDIFKVACYEFHPETEEPQCIHSLFRSFSSQESSSTSQSFSTQMSTPRTFLTPSLEFYITPNTGNKRKWSEINLIYKDSAVSNLISIDETHDGEESRLPDGISNDENLLQLSNTLSINERPVDNGGLSRSLHTSSPNLKSLSDTAVTNPAMMRGALNVSIPNREATNQTSCDTNLKGRPEGRPKAPSDPKLPANRVISIAEPLQVARGSVQTYKPLRKKLSRKLPKKIHIGPNDSTSTLVTQRSFPNKMREVLTSSSFRRGSRSMDKPRSNSAADVLSKVRDWAAKIKVPAIKGVKKSAAKRRGTLKIGPVRNLKVGVVAA